MDYTKKPETEVTEFLAKVVNGSCRVIEEKKMDAFDISFEFNDILYRLSLAKDSVNAYLKEN